MYEIGKTYHGFTLKEEREVKDISSICRLFEHEKTGARLLYVSNNDENKVFAIGFRTPPENDTGVPHILEHSVLCGSRKFPSKEPFVALLKSSQNTFLNAATYTDKTLYPVASMNDKDLENLMDVYLDAVFYPNIYNKKEIFMQEGWHYELKKPEDELKYKGVVYNEMKGILSSPETILAMKSFNYLYPNTCYKFEAGGEPEKIVDLSYEEFLNFHRRYYHPSNSYIYFYGNGDIEAHLRFINNQYLNNFEKAEIDSSIKLEQSFDAIREYEFNYPISSEDDDKHKSYFAVSFAVGNALNRELGVAIEILGEVLMGNNTSPLKKILLESKIAKNFYMDAASDPTLQPSINVVAFEADIDTKDEFKNIIFDTLSRIVDEKIDKELIEGAINKKEFILREANSGKSPKGLIYLDEAFKTWLYDGNPIDVFEYSKYLDILKNKMNNGYFENIIKTYILENTHSVFVVLKPEKGLSEEKIKAEKQRLNKIKQTMSKEQVDEIIKGTNKLIELQEKEDSKEELEQIPRLKLSDIKRENTWIDLEDREIGGVRTIYYGDKTNKIMYITLNFDLKTVDKELLKYIALFKVVLGELNTKNFSSDELAKQIDKNIGRFRITTRNVINYNNNKEYEPQLIVSTKGLASKTKEMVEIVNEIIQNTIFDQDNKIHEIIKMLRANMKSAITYNGQEVAIDKLMASFMEVARYNECISGLESYNFLIEMDEKFDDYKQEIKTSLQKLKQIIFNKKYMSMLVVCEDEDYAAFEENISILLDNIETKEIEKQKYEFELKKEKLGLATQSDVQFVAKGYDYSKLGYAYSGKHILLKKILGYEYLWNEVRVKGGAYGSAALGSAFGNFVIVSWNDPNLKETLDIYDNTHKYLESMKLDASDIEKYIISTIGDLDIPFATPYQKAYNIENKLAAGITREIDQKIRNEILETTVEDIKGFAKMMKDLMKQDYICVLGNESKINENKDLFDRVERVR